MELETTTKFDIKTIFTVSSRNNADNLNDSEIIYGISDDKTYFAVKNLLSITVDIYTMGQHPSVILSIPYDKLNDIIKIKIINDYAYIITNKVIECFNISTKNSVYISSYRGNLESIYFGIQKLIMLMNYGNDKCTVKTMISVNSFGAESLTENITIKDVHLMGNKPIICYDDLVEIWDLGYNTIPKSVSVGVNVDKIVEVYNSFVYVLDEASHLIYVNMTNSEFIRSKRRFSFFKTIDEGLGLGCDLNGNLVLIHMLFFNEVELCSALNMYVSCCSDLSVGLRNTRSSSNEGMYALGYIDGCVQIIKKHGDEIETYDVKMFDNSVIDVWILGKRLYASSINSIKCIVCDF